MYSGQLGVIYDSKATNRNRSGGRGILKRNPLRFLLVAWESFKTPSHTAMHCFIAPDEEVLFHLISGQLTNGLSFLNEEDICTFCFPQERALPNC